MPPVVFCSTPTANGSENDPDWIAERHGLTENSDQAVKAVAAGMAKVIKAAAGSHG
jgi:hypothetical protein